VITGISKFSSVRDLTVVEAVQLQLKTLIRNGQLKPDEKLPTEDELRNQLNVSRTAVREAIRSLAGEGLLEVRRGQGTFVSALDPSTAINREVLLLLLSPRNIEEIQEARRILEPEILTHFVKNASKESFEELEEILNVTEEFAKAGQSVFELSWKFHRKIANFAGQSVLAVILDVIYEMIRVTERPIFEEYFDPYADVEGHRYLLNILRERDATLARKAILEHLDEVEKKIKLSMKSENK
jgi:GntR family transcriptional repressor for pyruvate dehydrogenase complex